MSIKCMSRIWESARQKGASLLCLLAIADFADENGFAWPAISTIARKTRMSTRHMSRILQALADNRELCIVRRKANQSNLYIVTVGLDYESFVVAASRAKEFGGQGDILSWWGQGQGDILSGEGDILSGEGDILSGEGDKMSDEHDIAMSSDPSLPSNETINEPPENHGPPPENSGYSQKPENQTRLQEKFGADPLSGLAKHAKRQEAKLQGRPPGWGSVNDMPGVWAICKLVAEQFPCVLPVARQNYNAATRERALHQIDVWTGGAALLLEKFGGDTRRTLDAITAFRRAWDGGFTVAGPQSLVNSVGPGIVSKVGARRGQHWESVWTEAELEEAAARSLAEEPLDPKTFFAEG